VHPPPAAADLDRPPVDATPSFLPTGRPIIIILPVLHFAALSSMKQPQSTMNTAYAAATVIGLACSGSISFANAFSSPGRSSSLAARSPHHLTPLSSPRANDQCSLLTLSSTLEEASETEAFSPNNETLNDNLLAKKQLQQVLSSPELIDPAAVLDATIGIIVPDDTSGVIVLDSLASDDATLFAAAASIVAKEVELKEDDLELTRQAIMQHDAQQASRDDSGFKESVEGDLDGSTVLFETPVVETPDDLSSQELDSVSPEISTSLHEQQQPITIAVTKKSSILNDNTPSIKKILRYTIPAIGVWLCSPILSMIDTAAVGLLSGTAQQAALNPAVSIADYGALVVAFMYTATTNLIAGAVQEDKDADDAAQPKTAKTLITSLKLALFTGTVFSVLLATSSKFLLKLLIGNSSLDPTVFNSALRYIQIRALGMPAMVVIGTAQSACLGMQDVKSPLYVLAAAAGVNFVGDVFLVPHSSALFGGAAGAAWATVASQYAALLFFARWLTTSAIAGDKRSDTSGTDDGATKKMNFFWNKNKKNTDGSNKYDTNDVHVVDVTKGILELTGSLEEGQSRRKEFRKFLTSSKLSRRIRSRATSKFKSIEDQQSPITTTPTATTDTIIASKNKDIKPKKQPPKTRGFLSNGRLTLRSYLSPSNLNKSIAKKFLPFIVPVTTTSIGRISGYIAMSHVASSTLGTYDMAAHQIIFSIFCCLAPLVDALNQVAQSFVPAVFEAKEKSVGRAMALRKTTNNFRKVGAGFGLVLVSLVSCIPWISRYFTTDAIVLTRVTGAIPGVALFLLVNGLMCAGEGTMLGQKDLNFLRNMYTLFSFTVPAYMLRLKHRSLAGVQVVSIGTMWAAFSVYNVIRTAIWHLRLMQLQRRTDAGVEAVDDDTRWQ